MSDCRNTFQEETNEELAKRRKICEDCSHASTDLDCLACVDGSHHSKGNIRQNEMNLIKNQMNWKRKVIHLWGDRIIVHYAGDWEIHSGYQGIGWTLRHAGCGHFDFAELKTAKEAAEYLDSRITKRKESA